MNFLYDPRQDADSFLLLLPFFLLFVLYRRRQVKNIYKHGRESEECYFALTICRYQVCVEYTIYVAIGVCVLSYCEKL